MKRSIRVAVRAASTALVAVGVSGVVVPIANASKTPTIVVGQGIGAKIDQTEGQVMKALGKPVAKRKTETGEREWQYGTIPKGDALFVFFKHKHVVLITTGSAPYKTSSGISVNSLPAEVSKAYPQAKCVLGSGPQPDPGEESDGCTVTSRYHGHTVHTVFLWRDSRRTPMFEIVISA